MSRTKTKKPGTQNLRILHTADWHLGKRLDRFSRLEEQREVLGEICDIADREAVDVVLIAGDIYDTPTPSQDAEALFYQTIVRLAKGGRRAVVAIAGNHDSPRKIENPDPIARACGIFFYGYPDTLLAPLTLEPAGLRVNRSAAGFVELQLPGSAFPLRLLLTPYAHLARFRERLAPEGTDLTLSDLMKNHWQLLAEEYCDAGGVNLLMAHLFMARKGGPLPEESADEKSILYIGGAEAIYADIVPPQVQYVALGHLHRHQSIADQPCPMVYSSSILSYSMNEADQAKYVVILEASPGKKVNYRKIALKSGRKLLKETFQNVDDAVTWLRQHPDAIVEIYMKIEAQNYLTAEARQRLYQSHDYLLNVIPIMDDTSATDSAIQDVDLSRDTETLFKEFHQYVSGTEASEDLLAMLREILGKESG